MQKVSIGSIITNSPVIRDMFEHKAKSLPIQMVHFRKQDIVPETKAHKSLEKTSRAKFNCGDGVKIKTGQYKGCFGTIEDYDTFRRRKIYVVRISGKSAVLENYYSYELDFAGDYNAHIQPAVKGHLKSSRDEKLEYLRTQWKVLCNTYLEVFCKKHDFPFEPDMWVHDDPGTVVCVSDMYVNMDDLRYDIDHDVPETYFRAWYWKSLELYELCGEKYMNYESYCKGAPDYWTEERMAQIRESKRRIEKAREELEQTIKDTAKGKLF